MIVIIWIRTQSHIQTKYFIPWLLLYRGLTVNNFWPCTKTESHCQNFTNLLMQKRKPTFCAILISVFRPCTWLRYSEFLCSDILSLSVSCLVSVSVMIRLRGDTSSGWVTVLNLGVPFSSLLANWNKNQTMLLHFLTSKQKSIVKTES